MAVEAWGVEDVLRWLRDEELGDLVPAFEKARCDGRALLALTDAKLVEMGVASKRDRGAFLNSQRILIESQQKKKNKNKKNKNKSAKVQAQEEEEEEEEEQVKPEKQPKTNASDAKLRPCEHHKGRFCEYYCLNDSCKAFVCSDCCVTKMGPHHSHDVYPIDQVAEQHRLQATATALPRLSQLKKHTDAISSGANGGLQNNDKVVNMQLRDAKALGKRLHAAVDKFEDMLTDKIGEASTQKRAVLSRSIEKALVDGQGYEKASQQLTEVVSLDDVRVIEELPPLMATVVEPLLQVQRSLARMRSSELRVDEKKVEGFFTHLCSLADVHEETGIELCAPIISLQEQEKKRREEEERRVREEQARKEKLAQEERKRKEEEERKRREEEERRKGPKKCGQCDQEYTEAANHPKACSYHGGQCGDWDYGAGAGYACTKCERWWDGKGCIEAPHSDNMTRCRRGRCQLVVPRGDMSPCSYHTGYCNWGNKKWDCCGASGFKAKGCKTEARHDLP